MRWTVVVVVALASCGRYDFAQGAYCSSLAPQPTFCSDFDGSDPWSDTMMHDGSLAIGGGALSAPNALVVTTDTLDSGTSASVYRRITDLASTPRVMIAFDVRVDTFGQSDPVLAQFLFDDGTMFHVVNYVYREPPRVAYIEDVATPYTGASTYTSYPFQSVSVGTWHRLTMAIDVAANTLGATADGATTLDDTPTVTTSGDLSVSIGVPYLNGPSSPWQVRFDNVVIQL